jgi:hypothetical protein
MEYRLEGQKFKGGHAFWRGVRRPNFVLDVKVDKKVGN